jgi:hypothetical protein
VGWGSGWWVDEGRVVGQVRGDWCGVEGLEFGLRMAPGREPGAGSREPENPRTREPEWRGLSCVCSAGSGVLSVGVWVGAAVGAWLVDEGGVGWSNLELSGPRVVGVVVAELSRRSLVCGWCAGRVLLGRDHLRCGAGRFASRGEDRVGHLNPPALSGWGIARRAERSLVVFALTIVCVGVGGDWSCR